MFELADHHCSAQWFCPHGKECCCSLVSNCMELCASYVAWPATGWVGWFCDWLLSNENLNPIEAYPELMVKLGGIAWMVTTFVWNSFTKGENIPVCLYLYSNKGVQSNTCKKPQREYIVKYITREYKQIDLTTVCRAKHVQVRHPTPLEQGLR